MKTNETTKSNELILINWFEQQFPIINYVYVKNGQKVELLSDFLSRKEFLIVPGCDVGVVDDAVDLLSDNDEWFAIIEQPVLDFIYNNLITISEDADELTLIVTANTDKVTEKIALEAAETLKENLGIFHMQTEFIDDPDYEMIEIVDDKNTFADVVEAYEESIKSTSPKKTNKPVQPKVIDYSTTKTQQKSKTAKQIEKSKKTIVVDTTSKVASLRESIYKSPKAKTILYDITTTKEQIIPDKNGINIVFAKDGVYEVVHGGFGIFVLKNSDISNMPNSIPLKKFDLKDQWFIPKPDESILNRLIELDRYVYKKTKAEFYANVIWDYEKEAYEIDIPKQVISGATVEFDEFVNTKTRIKVIDHHSHNVMSSFFSGTDNANDIARFKISIVIGNLTNNDFSVSARKVVAGLFQTIDYKQIFNIQDKFKDDKKIVDDLFKDNTISTRQHNEKYIYSAGGLHFG